MNPRPQALRLGLFMVLGLALLVVAIAFVLGGQLFASRTPVLMRYSGSVYGLQVGSPVVFRGVNIGSVTGIGLGRDSASGQIEIPVTAMLDQAAVDQLGPTLSAASPRRAMDELLRQGLSARLATQSLLTGKLYVDLDLRPGQSTSGPHASPPGMPDIPTLPTTIQALQAQLEGVDLKAALQDLAAIAAATRQFIQDPQLKATVANAAQLSSELRTLASSLQRELVPLSAATQQTLAQARNTAGALSEAATRIAQTAQSLDSTLGADSPVLQSFQRTAQELTSTAISLRNTTGEDAELVINLNRAARDVARAARQLGDLTQLLERQPDVLLRGRAPAATPAP